MVEQDPSASDRFFLHARHHKVPSLLLPEDLTRGATMPEHLHMDLNFSERRAFIKGPMPTSLVCRDLFVSKHGRRFGMLDFKGPGPQLEALPAPRAKLQLALPPREAALPRPTHRRRLALEDGGASSSGVGAPRMGDHAPTSIAARSNDVHFDDGHESLGEDGREGEDQDLEDEGEEEPGMLDGEVDDVDELAYEPPSGAKVTLVCRRVGGVLAAAGASRFEGACVCV